MSNHESKTDDQAKLSESFSVDRFGTNDMVLYQYEVSGETVIEIIDVGLKLSPRDSIHQSEQSERAVKELMHSAAKLCEPICNACPSHGTACSPSMLNGIENGRVVLYVQNDLDAPLPKACGIYNPSNPTSP